MNQIGNIIYSVSKLKTKKHLVNQDNVKYYDALIKSDGNLFTVDARPYIDIMTDMNLLFTFQPLN